MPIAFTPFPVIETNFHAPLSGDVTQRIEPRVFSPDIAGNPETEWRIHRNVASYGKQLGKIFEALEVIATELDKDGGLLERDEIKQVIAYRKAVDSEKEDHAATLRRQAEEALDALKAVDAVAWEDVRGA